MAFTVSCTRHAGFVRMHLRGELDLSTAPDFNAVLDKLIEEGERHLLVDLAELSFCDSTGLAAFVRGDDEARSRDGWLRLTGAAGRVDRVLRISGLAELFRYDQDHDRPDPAPLRDR